MVPDTTEYDITDADTYETPTTYTYKLDFVNKRIIGKVDGVDAVVQFMQKVLSTTKYSYEIYDWYYGIEMNEILGMPYDYVCLESQRLIEEALLVDDRILSLTNFEFERAGVDGITITFTANTIYGDLEYSTEVNA